MDYNHKSGGIPAGFSMVKEGLAKAETLVVQDIFHPTETTLQGDVILPAAQ